MRLTITIATLLASFAAATPLPGNKEVHELSRRQVSYGVPSAVNSTITASPAASYTATSTGSSTPTPSSHSGTPYKAVMYYPNWDIYGRNFQPNDLPASQLSHVLYSFANVRPDTGEVYLSDTYADLEKHYPTDSWNDNGTNVYGCVKQLYMLKQKNRYMKTLLSIGGWTYSPSFAQAASTPEGRATFASSSVTLLKDLGFDGLDIDWEYPKDTTEAHNAVLLLQAVRSALDAYAAKVPGNPHFLLTVATAAGPTNYQKLDLAGMDASLDFWNLMAYDFAGSWDTTAGHQSNLFPDTSNTNSTPFSTNAAVAWYLQNGIAPSKLVLGMPLYGRAFTQTLGPGTPFTGVGAGSWENGVWDYKVLPPTGAREFYDPVIGASWSYDTSTQTMISYDTPDMALQKMQYIKDLKLGGAMWWEANGNVNSTSARNSKGQVKDLVELTVQGFEQLDGEMNVLAYPESKYDNIRNGMA